MTIEEKTRAIRKKLRMILPDWINFQNGIFLTVILAFVFIVLWSESLAEHLESVKLDKLSATTTPTILPGTPTPLPAELLASAEQTNGIMLGAIVIVLTILVGTFVMVLRESSK